jgi:hypothetical protein
MIDLRVMYKEWPKATREEQIRCVTGGRSCPRCQAMLDVGINPYTMEREEV